MKPETIEMLKKFASMACWDDNFYDNEGEPTGELIDDYAGGNIDDAYDGGMNTGTVMTAREILKMEGIEWSS